MSHSCRKSPSAPSLLSYSLCFSAPPTSQTRVAPRPEIQHRCFWRLAHVLHTASDFHWRTWRLWHKWPWSNPMCQAVFVRKGHGGVREGKQHVCSHSFLFPCVCLYLSAIIENPFLIHTNLAFAKHVYLKQLSKWKQPKVQLNGEINAASSLFWKHRLGVSLMTFESLFFTLCSSVLFSIFYFFSFVCRFLYQSRSNVWSFTSAKREARSDCVLQAG